MFDRHVNSGFKPRRGMWIFLPFVFVAALAAFGWVVMFLWNAILPDVAGFKPLNFWQALGLLALCRILFGGFGGGSRRWNDRHKGRRERWMNMSEEERQRMREAWAERCKRKEDF